MELNAFTSRRKDRARVASPPEDVWRLLVDPDVLARHTPFLRQVEDLGDGRWRWHLTGVRHPGGSFATSFTERMGFESPSRITFTHEPDSVRELAGAEGTYTLTPVGTPVEATDLVIELAVTARLPVPSAFAPVVERAMGAVLTQMGAAFARGLTRELGLPVR